MTLNEIERTLRELLLSGITTTLNTRVMHAKSSQQPLLETLAGLLQDELDRRHSRLTERRFKQSRLDERAHARRLRRALQPQAASSGLLRAPRPKRGTGKSHVALFGGRPATGVPNATRSSFRHPGQGHAGEGSPR